MPKNNKDLDWIKKLFLELKNTPMSSKELEMVTNDPDRLNKH